MRGLSLLAGLACLLGCSGGAPEADTGATYTVEPPDPCPALYRYEEGFCVVREVFVPGGTFTMGRGECKEPQAQENPLGDCVLRDEPQEVTVASFFIDVAPIFPQRYPCDRAQGSCLWNDDPEELPYLNSLAGSGNYGMDDPIEGTSVWYCEEEGKRLIREDEWEYVVTAGGRRTYPWGDDPPSCDKARWDLSCPSPPDPPIRNWSEIRHIPLDHYPPSPEGIYALVDLVPHMVAPSPHVYGPSYDPTPFERFYTSVPDDCFHGPHPSSVCSLLPWRCKTGDPHYPPPQTCKELAWGVRGGRVAGPHNELLRSPLALRGFARSLSVNDTLMYLRCVRDAP